MTSLAALFNLLLSDNPTDRHALDALGFEPRSDSPDDEPRDESVAGNALGQSGAIEQGDTPAVDETPETAWVFPAVIIARRQQVNPVDGSDMLATAQDYHPGADVPLGDAITPSPLMSAEQLQKALETEFLQLQPSRKLDARRLTHSIAARRAIDPLPRRSASRTVSRYRLIIDHMPEFASEIVSLQKAFRNFPLGLQALTHIRLSEHPGYWFDQNDQLQPLKEMPPAERGIWLLVVGNRNPLTAQMTAALEQCATPQSTVTWLDLDQRTDSIYWGSQRSSLPDDEAIKIMETLLWPMPCFSCAMLRDLCRSIGASTRAEYRFLASCSEIEMSSWYAVQSDKRIDARHNWQQWKQRDSASVEKQFRVLLPHINAMQATHRHEVALNLPETQYGETHRRDAVQFYAGLLKAGADTQSQVERQKFSAIVLGALDRLLPEKDDDLRVLQAIAQRQFAEFYPQQAMLAGQPQAAMLGDGNTAFLTQSVNGLLLSTQQTSGSLTEVEVASEAGVVETEKSVSLVNVESPLPTTDFTLHTANESIDVTIANNTRFYWAESLTQSSAGLTLETSEGLKVYYPADGTGPIISPAPHHVWLNVSATGVDEYGLYTQLVLAGITQTMRWIPPGRFLMGSPQEEPERYGDDERQHSVVLTSGYWLADTACSQQLWQAVMSTNSSNFKGEQIPVDSVSWEDASKFLTALTTAHPGLSPILPSEAQWEYACRAGSSGPFNTGSTITTEQANFNGNHPYDGAAKGEYREQTVEVKHFDPNAWGLHQMHGNVLEWCSDWYGDYQEGEVIDPQGVQDGAYRVLRGGSWINYARFCRSANRDRYEPAGRGYDVGFRFAQAGYRAERV